MIGERLKYIRENLDLTQEEFANSIDVKRSTYSLWELNKNVIPLENIINISNKYKVNIDYICCLSNEFKSSYNKIAIDKKIIGCNIKNVRKEINFTQEKLASKLNTTHSVISAYESGKTKIPTLFLIEIAKLSNKSIYIFLINQKESN